MRIDLKKTKFVSEYLNNGGNATDAAKKEGYSKKTAHVQGPRLLGNVVVKEMLEKKRESITEAVDISTTYVLKGLKRVADRCLTEDNFDPSGANKALELLGKTKAMFTDKLAHEGGVVVQMGRVIKNGKPLEFKVGNAIKA